VPRHESRSWKEIIRQDIGTALGVARAHTDRPAGVISRIA
jgi:hypothetical protein